MRNAFDEDRFFALLGQHKGILAKIAFTYCQRSEDRRDLVQEMTIALWKSFPRFDERVLFSTWMYRVATNVAISFFRGEARRIRDTVPIEDFGLELAGADVLFDEASDNMRALQSLIGELDEMNRALILLFLDGTSHEEIAAALGISTSSVSSRINRLKLKLQEQFTGASAYHLGERA